LSTDQNTTQSVAIPMSVLKWAAPVVIGMVIGGGSATGLTAWASAADLAALGDDVATLSREIQELRLEIIEDRWRRSDHEKWSTNILEPRLESLESRVWDLERRE